MDVISGLPIDLISSLISYLDFFSVQWFAQASKRTNYLVETGLTSLSLGEAALTPFAALNAAIIYKGLKYLRLVYIGRPAKPQRLITINQLEMLPSGLRMLHIPIRGAQKDVNKMISSLPRRLETLGLTIELGEGEKSMALEISVFPPLLVSLSIKSNYKWSLAREEGEDLPNLENLKVGWNLEPGTVKSFVSATPSLMSLILHDYSGQVVDLDSFPPNLTLLSSSNGWWDAESLSKLPRNLLVFEASSYGLPISLCHLLPPNLTRLITSNYELKSNFQVLKYDKTATEFAISFSYAQDEPFECNESFMHEPSSEYPTIDERMAHDMFCVLNSDFMRESLSPNLTSLYLNRIRQNFTPTDFPPLLTKLCLQTSDTKDFSGLPRQLLHFEVNSTLTLGSCLPPNLHTLKLWGFQRDLTNKPREHTISPNTTGNVAQNAPNVNAVLPKTLTHFTSAYKCFPHLSWIPPSVTELSLHYLNNVVLLDKDLCNLKSIDFATNESMTDASMTLLAPDLHTLKLTWNNLIGPSGLQKLPPTLTILDLQWNQKAVQDSSAGYLPRTLTKLNISCSSLLTHTGIALLPPQLTELQWDRCPNLGELAFAALPRSLTLLTLNQHPNIPSSGFKHLPNALKHLEMSGSRTFDSLEDLQFLPRSITYLDLKSLQHLDGNACLRLPRQLTYLNISLTHNLKSTDLWKTGFPSSLILPETIPRSEVLTGRNSQYFTGVFAQKIAY